MSKISIGQLVQSLPALKELNSVPLRPVVALRLAKAIKFTDKHISDFEAARLRLAADCSEMGEDGKPKQADGNFMLSDVGREKFNAGFKELLAEEYELPPSVKRIPIDHFDQPITPMTLSLIDWLIEEA